MLHFRTLKPFVIQFNKVFNPYLHFSSHKVVIPSKFIIFLAAGEDDSQ